MFVHSNGKINVLANTRCGSTATAMFFGFSLLDKYELEIEDWFEFSGKKVIILRNPYDRVMSACRTLDYLQELDRELGRELERNPQEFFVEHSLPYLHRLQKYDFSIILFEDLQKYLPAKFSYITDTNNVSTGTYIENSAYSAEDLRNEYLLYKTYKSEKDILDVDTWNKLCER